MTIQILEENHLGTSAKQSRLSDPVPWHRLCDSVDERRRNPTRSSTPLIRRYAQPCTRVSGVGKFVCVPRISHAAFWDHT